MSTSSTASPKRRRGLVAAVVVAGTALLAALVALALALSGLIAIPGITAASGEIVLQGADEPGLDPFAEGLAGPAAGTAPAPIAAPVVSAGSSAVVSAGAPGLYGGTNDNSRCDPGQLIAFLGSNPAKAQAWVAALNADPNLQWGTGTLTTTEVPAYVASLTPLVLLTDTLVTNHGFVNGSPTPFQSVLQAGTAVLVDRFGVPRSRCLCGNPLIPSAAALAAPTYVGTQWPGFSPANVVIVQPTVAANNSFTVVPYPAGGTPITVAAGNCVLGQPCPSPWTAGPTPAPVATASPTPTPTTPATAAPTTSPTTSPSPSPTLQPGQPADAVPPTAGSFGCGTAGPSSQWVRYETPDSSVITSDFDIWRIDDTCTPVWQVRSLFVPNSGGFGWMGFEGETVVLTDKSATIVYQGTVPVGGGPLL